MVRTLPTIETNRGPVQIRDYDSSNVRVFAGPDENWSDQIFVQGDYVEVHLYDRDGLCPEVQLRMDEGGIATSFTVDEETALELIAELEDHDVEYEVTNV